MFYHKQISNLAMPYREPLTSQILELRNKFLEGLYDIQSKSKGQLIFLEPNKSDIFEYHKESISSRLSKEINSSKWVEISEENFIRAGKVLAEAFLDQTEVRQIIIKAPLFDLINQFIVKGFYHYKRKKPIANIFIASLHDREIIKCYSKIMYDLSNYYQFVDNLVKIKGLLEGLRKSCCLTLAYKHKKPLAWVYATYSIDVKLNLLIGGTISLPSREYITNLTSKIFVSEGCRFNLNAILKKYKLCNSFDNNTFN